MVKVGVVYICYNNCSSDTHLKPVGREAAFLSLKREVRVSNPGAVKSNTLLTVLPLRQFFERSYVACRRNEAEMDPSKSKVPIFVEHWGG